MRLSRTIWTLDVNGALELKSYPVKSKYEVYMIPPVGNGRHVLKTDSKSKLRIWMDLNGPKPEFPNLLSRKNRKAAEKNYETLNVRLVQ